MANADESDDDSDRYFFFEFAAQIRESVQPKSKGIQYLYDLQRAWSIAWKQAFDTALANVDWAMQGLGWPPEETLNCVPCDDADMVALSLHCGSNPSETYSQTVSKLFGLVEKVSWAGDQLERAGSLPFKCAASITSPIELRVWCNYVFEWLDWVGVAYGDYGKRTFTFAWRTMHDLEKAIPIDVYELAQPLFTREAPDWSRWGERLASLVDEYWFNSDGTDPLPAKRREPFEVTMEFDTNHFRLVVVETWRLLRAVPGRNRPFEPLSIGDAAAVRHHIDEVVAWCDLQEMTAVSSPSPIQAFAPATDARPQIDKETQALALLLTVGPNAAAIARAINVPRPTLLGWRRFRQHYDKLKADGEATKRRHPRGHKAHGRVEAWQDDVADDEG